MSERLSRIVPMFVYLFIFVLMAIGIHEQGHFIVAEKVGINGYATFTEMGGRFVYQDPTTGAYILVTLWQDMMIGFGGGLLAGGAFMILWAVNHWRGWYTPESLDESFVFGAMWVSQWIYAIGEGIEKWSPAAPYWSQPIGVLFAILGVLALYGRRLLAWWEGIRAPTANQIEGETQ